jgi:hypothetical protein
MNYTKYRYRAVVDWLEIEIECVEPKKFWTIQDAVKNALSMPEYETPFVKAIDGDNHASKRFMIRIQDPETAKSIDDLLTTINDEIPLVPGARIVASEIALDAYGAPPEFVCHLFKYITNHVDTNQRLYRDYKGSGQAIPSHLDSLIRYVSDGYQIGIGDTTADRYQHGYYKQTDGKYENGKPNSLDLKDQRPRFEIRLRGGGLPFSDWNDWRCFKFESLRKDYFNFRKLKDSLTAEQRADCDNRSLHVGLKKTRPGRDGRTREFSRITVADKELNELVRDSLRNLSKRWKSKNCKKVGRTITAKPSKCGKSDDSSYNYTLQEDVLISIVKEIEGEETAPKDKDYPEKLGFQLEQGKSYVR